MRILLALVLLLTAACRSAIPDVVLAGGKVSTADPERPWAEAVAVGGDRILAVGTDAEALEMATTTSVLTMIGGKIVWEASGVGPPE